MTIYYTLEFYSFWHAGSGLGTRTDYDAIVIKDEKNIAYVPGKTIAGLVKDAAQDLVRYGANNYTSINPDELFGKDNPKPSKGTNPGKLEEETTDGICSFNNAYPLAYEKIRNGGLTPYLYTARMATALEDHQAKNHSLRKIETTLPCVLSGSISNIPDDPAGFDTTYIFFNDCFRLIKRLGYNRTRGLGRCKFQIIERT